MIDWETYFVATLEELEEFRSRVTNPEWMDFLNHKIGSSILMAIAQCEPPDGFSEGVTEAVILARLEERCREKAKIQKMG
jgi:hypothetical protein